MAAEPTKELLKSITTCPPVAYAEQLCSYFCVRDHLYLRYCFLELCLGAQEWDGSEAKKTVENAIKTNNSTLWDWLWEKLERHWQKAIETGAGDCLVQTSFVFSTLEKQKKSGKAFPELSDVDALIKASQTADSKGEDVAKEAVAKAHVSRLERLLALWRVTESFKAADLKPWLMMRGQAVKVSRASITNEPHVALAIPVQIANKGNNRDKPTVQLSRVSKKDTKAETAGADNKTNEERNKPPQKSTANKGKDTDTNEDMDNKSNEAKGTEEIILIFDPSRTPHVVPPELSKDRKILLTDEQGLCTYEAKVRYDPLSKENQRALFESSLLDYFRGSKSQQWMIAFTPVKELIIYPTSTNPKASTYIVDIAYAHLSLQWQQLWGGSLKSFEDRLSKLGKAMTWAKEIELPYPPNIQERLLKEQWCAQLNLKSCDGNSASS